jgi:hypothetical protein
MRATVAALGKLELDELTPEMRSDLMSLYRAYRGDS